MAEARSCPSAQITQLAGDEPRPAVVSNPMEEAIIQSPATSCAETEAVCALEDNNRLKITQLHRRFNHTAGRKPSLQC